MSRVGGRSDKYGPTLDIALYMGFIRGEYSTEKQRNEYKMKKLASRVCKPKTVTVQLRPNNKWNYGL